MRPISISIFLALATTSAFADSKAKAKQYLDRAGVAHKEGRFADALVDLKIAYTLDAQPTLLYAIGQVHVMQGQCDQAIIFYERFVNANPDPGQVAKAKEAIETCRKLQPDKPVEPVKPVEPAKPVRPVEPPKPVMVTDTRPWYTDAIGDALLGTGVLAGVTSVVLFRWAHSDRDRADTATDYHNYNELMTSAESKQTYSVVFAAGGAVLITGGIIRYLVHDRSYERPAVSVVPTARGGLVTWFARF